LRISGIYTKLSKKNNIYLVRGGQMSLLELFGIVFLAMVIINAFVGVWAVKTAGNEEDYSVSYSSGK
jgi:hypothetical protein